MAVTKGPFLVLSAKEDKTKTGKRYYSLQLKAAKDAGGAVTSAKIWEEVLITLEGRKVPPPVSGQIWEQAGYDEEEFNGQPQFAIRTYKVTTDPNPEQLERFREPAVIDTDVALRKLVDWRFWPPEYRQFFLNLISELKTDGLLIKLRDCPAGAKNHHDRRGGLLQHICEMVDISAILCGVIEEDPVTKVPLTNLFVAGVPGVPEVSINFSLLRASIIMHDMGKIHDYNTDTGQFEADMEGKLIQHSQWAMLAVERLWPKEGSKTEKLLLEHSVLVHHGRSVAPVAPQTPEAMLLHQIDAISAYMDVHRNALRLKSEGKTIPFNSMMGETPLVL